MNQIKGVQQKDAKVAKERKGEHLKGCFLYFANYYCMPLMLLSLGSSLRSFASLR